MSDNTKQKKAIRSRQKATGESYSTARLHVLRALPEARQDDGLADAGPDAGLVDASFATAPPPTGLRAAVEETIRLTRAGDDALLRAHLLGLPTADLRKLEVLMYAGRSRGGVRELAATLARDTHEMTVSVVAGKTPVLVGYLESGLRVATEEAIDLDGVWVKKPPTRWASAPGSDYDVAIDGMRAWDVRVPPPRDEAANKAALGAWAAREGVTVTHDHVCLRRLTPEGCPRVGRSCEELPGRDHTSMWLKAGEPHIYVTQPYDLDIETLDAMFRVARRLGLTVRVDAAPAWHDSSAVLIEVLRG